MIRCCVLFAVWGLSVCAAGGETLTLAKGGETPYAIVLATNACTNVRFAAFDLSNILKRVSGATFPVYMAGDPRIVGKKRIAIATAKAVRGRRTADWERLLHNGSLSYSTADGDIVLTGKDPYGTTGAVYDFLERQVGCRWYTAFGDEKIPLRPQLTLEPFSNLVNPPFEVRWVLDAYLTTMRVRNGDLFQFRNGLNTTGNYIFQNIDLPDGCPHLKCEYVRLGGYGHTLFLHIPPNDKRRYFAIHPEWFTFARNRDGGKRVADRQLCLTNMELRRELTKNFMAFVDSHHGHGVFNLSAMDVPGPFCDCEACTALAERYGTPGGPLFDYLAEVGELLLQRHPQALLSTLVYHKNQTQVPPNGNFRGFPPNIIAIFAPIDDDFSKSLDHPNNRQTACDLAVWSKLVKHVWAWYYPIPYTSIYPYAGVRRTAKDVRIMLRNGLTGASFEHDVARDAGANFFDLQFWVLTKLFRTPDADVEKLVREFCGHYYGAAAGDVWRYWDELERLRESFPERVDWNGNLATLYTPTRLASWKKALDAAERKVGSDRIVAFHVQQARLGLDRLALQRWGDLKRSKADLGQTTATSLRDSLTNFYAVCQQVRGGSMQKDVAKVEMDYLLSDAASLRPAEFKDVPEDDFRQSFAFRGGTGCKRRPEKDSCIGQAAWCDKESASDNIDLDCWIYDGFGKKNLLRTYIRNADMVEGKFHFYRLGRIRLTPDTYIALGSSWYLLSGLADLYVPGVDWEWDVYVSMKFEGPRYFPGSKASANRAVFDRTVLVRVR